MPDRVLWQFGMVQEIPSDPLVEQPPMREITNSMKGWMATATKLRMRSKAIPADLSFQMAEGYLHWFVSVSIPRLTAPAVDPQPAQPEPAQPEPAHAQPDDDDDSAPPRRRRRRRQTLRARIQGARDVVYTDPAVAYELLTGALAELDVGSDQVYFLDYMYIMSFPIRTFDTVIYRSLCFFVSFFVVFVVYNRISSITVKKKTLS